MKGMNKMPNIDWNAITEYYAGKSTHAAIRAGLYIGTLPEAQRTELEKEFH